MIKTNLFGLKDYFSKKLYISSLFLIGIFLPIIFAHAEKCDPATSGKICNPIAQTSIQGLIKNLLIGVIKIGIPVIALAIIYCGFLFVQARGNPKELETAKRSLTYTLIGAAILLGAWAIAQLISETVLSL
ncbi:MAG: pilin [bacterium]